jgi:hypothetical protein
MEMIKTARLFPERVAALTILALAFFAGPPATAQTVKTQIQAMSGWQSCSSCAGVNGAGPTATISTYAGFSSPSMTGNSRMFSIAGTKPYSDALWWKQLGAANSATNLVYDVFFYLKAPQSAQALEFDSNQADGHMRWIFGTECNIAAGVWDVYGNADGKWLSTGIPCHRPSAFTWHHLTWEFKRTSTQLTYIAVTLDGVKHYVNRTYHAKASTVKELNVAFQMDQRSKPIPFQTWLDKVSLKYW